MKTGKTILLSALMASIALSAFAQDAGTAAAPEAGAAQSSELGSLSFLEEVDSQAEMVPNARSSAEDFVASKGWTIGFNPDGRYVAVGSAGIIGSPSDKNFQTSRRIAFQKAMLEAKTEIVKQFSLEISSKLEYALTEPSEFEREEAKAAAAAVEPSILDKLRTLAHKKLDKELEKEGVTKDEPLPEEEVKGLLNTEDFKKITEQVARAQVGALVVSKIFEQDGEIAVVAYYSDKTKLLAGAINGTGACPKGKPRKNGSIRDWVRGLKVGTQLYPAMGVQLTTDEDGNIVILSYGQASAKSASKTSAKAAFAKATASADADIRSFAGEAVAFAQTDKEMQSSKEFENGTFESETDTSMEQRISAVADKLKITGITTLRTWNFVDKRSGTGVFGVVRMWSVKSSAQANESRESMAEAAKNRGGNVSAKTAALAGRDEGASPASKREEDPGKYKVESIESEDF